MVLQKKVSTISQAANCGSKNLRKAWKVGRKRGKRNNRDKKGGLKERDVGRKED